jgi:hypothetical protein
MGTRASSPGETHGGPGVLDRRRRNRRPRVLTRSDKVVRPPSAGAALKHFTAEGGRATFEDSRATFEGARPSMNKTPRTARLFPPSENRWRPAAAPGRVNAGGAEAAVVANIEAPNDATLRRLPAVGRIAG